MIFGTVGSTEFDDLVERIDALAPALDEPVTCQIGLGRYVPRHCEHFRFAPSLDDFFRARERSLHGKCSEPYAMAPKRVGVDWRRLAAAPQSV